MRVCPVIIHLPHASVLVPPSVAEQFALTPADLDRELILMTDRYTEELFDLDGDYIKRLIYPVSRLVVDPERFRDDAEEPMSDRGMGAVYVKTAYGTPLRNPLAPQEREQLLRDYYDPHHTELARLTADALDHHRRCLILDAHSFPSNPLPCDLNQEPNRPDICIGTDPFHTPTHLVKAAVHAFERRGWSVGVDWPYSGAMVPMEFYRCDARAIAIMIEINRARYMDERSGEKLAGFEEFAGAFKVCVGKIVVY